MRAFFAEELPAPIDHVLVTGPGPYYAPLPEFDFDMARRDVESHLMLPIRVAQSAAGKVRPGGTLLFMGGTGGRGTGVGLTLIAALTAAMPALVKNLDARREQLRGTLPIARVVGPGDVAALAVHLMANTALTGGTYDIDGGQPLL